MMNKHLLMLAVLSVASCSVFAQWSAPSAPTSSELSTSEAQYLYNADAGGFYMGANDWGTRASVVADEGLAVTLVSGSASDYVIKCSSGNLFIASDGIWVDGGTNRADSCWVLTQLDDGTYTIGVSSANPSYGTDTYVNSYLCIIPEMDDTRLYLASDDDYTSTEGYDPTAFQKRWYFVAADDYEAYISDLQTYNAAVELGELIDEAGALSGVDSDVLSDATEVYNNTSSTADELTAAADALSEAIFDAQTASATADSPVEILALLGTVEQTFDDSETTGWTSTTGASNVQASNGNAAYDSSVTGNHYENWSGSAFIGKVYATVSVPAGVYKLQALAFASPTGDTYLYCGDDSTLVETTQVNVDYPTTAMTATDEGDLEFGLINKVATANWIGLDNVYLYYYGNGTDAYTLLVEYVLTGETDYEALVEASEIEAYCHADYDAYVAAKQALEASTSAEEIQANLAAYQEALATFETSLAAYEAYVAAWEEADDWLTAMDNGSDEAGALADYIQGDDSEGYNGNGAYWYIVENGTLDAEGITAETEYLTELYYEARSSGMSDGDDCTSWLVNADFSEDGGWTSAAGPTWPDGLTDTYPVMEAWNMVCDVYQELSGLQNGLYEFTLHTAFRPGADGYSEEDAALAEAYVYINDYEKQIAEILSEPTDEAAYSDDYQYSAGYAPSSAEGASTAFAAGRYSLTCYGLVTDGTMKIGITNKTRAVEHCMLWAGGATLTFRATNEEALATAIEDLLPTVQALTDSYCGQAELDTLTDAIETATSASDDLYDALLALKNAQLDVEEGTSIYTNLATALSTLASTLADNDASEDLNDEAQALYDEALAAYQGQTYDNDAATAAITALATMNTSLLLGDSDDTDYPIDYTELIVNYNMDPDRGSKDDTYIEGWTTSALNGYGYNTARYNRSVIELYQTISGLPAGKYVVTVYGYYRAGYWYEEESYMTNGVETQLATLYATTSDSTTSTPVLNLTEGATEEIYYESAYYTLSSGLYAPDGGSASAAWFSAGAYLNELTFYVPEDGEVTIGIDKQEIIANDYAVFGEWHLYYYGPDDEDSELDYTELIVNYNMDPDRGSKDDTYIEGWTTSALNGYGYNTARYNRSVIELYQTISGLPAGDYKTTVYGYYRAGYWYEEESYMANGVDTQLADLYATTSDGTTSTPVLNLTEGATEEIYYESAYYTLSSGLYAPDGGSASAAWFSEGAYLNELYFSVPDDGTVTIGIDKQEIIANDYAVFGEWHLYYYPNGLSSEDDDTETGIGSVLVAGSSDATPVAYYSLSGARLNAPQSGVNLVRMSDGHVYKVLVK